MSCAETIEHILLEPDRKQKRQAFVKVLATQDWREVLAPHVISTMGYEVQGAVVPDEATFYLAAPVIAASEEKIQRVLELLESKFAPDLLVALAHQMGSMLAEHLLPHLRTAEAERSLVLQRILYQADPNWVRHPGAKRVIKKELRKIDLHRTELIKWLADAGNLGDFLPEIQDHPPLCVEEWNSLGLAGIHDEGLINRALGTLGKHPDALAYLLRLKEVPEAVHPRMMSAARTNWLVNALEVAIYMGVFHEHLLSLAELAIRLGGRPMSAAISWLNAANLGKEILTYLAQQMKENGKAFRANSQLWISYRPPSPDRALERGRRGEIPDPMDAATLIRQLRGERVTELVQEILTKPHLAMMETVLRPLCGVNEDAAKEVQMISVNDEPAIAHRAQDALKWPDVAWPEI